MCTAITYKTKDHYFGRTLDYECTYGEQVTVMPRHFPLGFRHMGMLDSHYAIIGMAHVAEGYPLYYDAVNEKGLGMAGLNFVGNAVYRAPEPGQVNIASFELMPWILAGCATVKEAVACMENLNLTDDAFGPQLPPAQLHWMIADADEAVTVESTRDGIRVWPNPVGVLTNNPPFDQQLFRLNDFIHLSPKQPENRFSHRLSLDAYSRGMGALGLPGDLSSQSRFVRAAFVKLNAQSGEGEAVSVGQCFHILGAVELVRGCCLVAHGQFEFTQYTSCANAAKGIYYYTTYGNRQITALDMHRCDLDSCKLIRYPLIRGEQIRLDN